MSYYKDFKFVMKTKSGKKLVETEVRFGTEENPWPEDWKESGMALMTLLGYEEQLINEFIVITKEEL